MTIREHTLDLIMAIVLPPGCLSMKNAMDKLNVAGNDVQPLKPIYCQRGKNSDFGVAW